ncbi:uncharacterized protein V2V93DRAFT_371721 [Kockiozyma suomiensis]|uniref:uncharacterized protein n=1 Tax=Kockiozyma suomiensis TaxID=1337062 RepID=UPI0033434A31
MSTLMYLKMLFVGTGITGIGVGLYKNTVPTEEQIVKEFSPAIQQKYKQEKAYTDSQATNEKLRALIESNANSSRPVWMLTEKIEPRCVSHERDRVVWSQRSLEKARGAAREKMFLEKERLQKLEDEEQAKKRGWFFS